MNNYLFDCNAGVGKTGLGYFAEERADNFLSLMDYYGIKEALVYDLNALENGLFVDDWIVKFCKRSERLHPSIILSPPACGEQPDSGTIIDIMRENKIKAVRMYPEWHNFDFLPYCLGPLFELLQKYKIPVFYNSYNYGDHPWLHKPRWDHIARTAASYPDMPIIVLYTGMIQNRRILPLLKKFANIKVDISCHTFNFIEYVTENMGADRLLFGTCYPVEDPGLYVMPVNYSRIDSRKRKLIAGNNLRNLLKGVEID